MDHEFFTEQMAAIRAGGIGQLQLTMIGTDAVPPAPEGRSADPYSSGRMSTRRPAMHLARGASNGSGTT